MVQNFIYFCLKFEPRNFRLCISKVWAIKRANLMLQFFYFCGSFELSKNSPSIFAYILPFWNSIRDISLDMLLLSNVVGDGSVGLLKEGEMHLKKKGRSNNIWKLRQTTELQIHP